MTNLFSSLKTRLLGGGGAKRSASENYKLYREEELLSSKCNFNSQSNKGGGRYLISSALKALGEYIYIYIYQEGRLQSNQGRNSKLFKNGGDWLNRVSHLLMKRGVINAN